MRRREQRQTPRPSRLLEEAEELGDAKETRKTQNCFFNIPQKTFGGKFRMFEELAW